MSVPLSNLVQRAFAAGELAPAFGARADLVAYTRGLRTCRNFWVQRSGGVATRPGFRFIREVKDSSKPTLLYRWVFTAASDSTLIELGDQYMRFFQNGARVQVTIADETAWSNATAYVVGDLAESGGVVYYCLVAHTNQAPPNATYWYALPADPDDATQAVYEIPTPWTSGSFDSPEPPRFTQNGATIVITHPGYARRALESLSRTPPRWTLSTITGGPTIAAPDNFTWTPGTPGPSGGFTLAYVVTAIDADTFEESLPCAPNSAAGVGLPTDLAPDELAWDPVDNAREYRIYFDPCGNGTFGYLGTATGQTTFSNPGFAPDFALTPPELKTVFDTSLDYPVMSVNYQQRQLYAYTHNQPSTVWASRIGVRDNFTIRVPLQDDDAIEFTLASRELNVIRHLIALKRLVILTDAGEWIVRGDETGVLTPSTINADQEGYIGASTVVPVIIGNSILYVQARGSILRDLSFDTQAQASLGGRDLTVYAGHLVDGYTLRKVDYQQVPHSIVWAVRDDGTLLGLTYIREDDTWGWHRHDTGAAGQFEDVCVVPEDDRDVVYAIVNRTIEGATRRYIEQLAPRLRDDENLAAGIFVDAAITYDGSETDTITGLDHLEGESVMALVDGVPQGPFTVESGQITLSAAGSLVQVGLPITYDLETLDLDANGTSVRDKRKRVQSVSVLLEASAPNWYAGPDEDHLFPQQREVYLSQRELLDGLFEINLTCTWEDTGRVLIRHTDPTPLTVLAIIPRFEVGG